MTFDDILGRLEGVRRSGDLRAMARCPAHEDRSPSLSLRELPDGIIVFKCFTGCDNAQICKALGIEFADLFPGGKIRRVDVNERRTGLAPSERLMLIEHEVAVALFILSDFEADPKSLTHDNVLRLAKCVQRIESAAHD